MGFVSDLGCAVAFVRLRQLLSVTHSWDLDGRGRGRDGLGWDGVSCDGG